MFKQLQSPILALLVLISANSLSGCTNAIAQQQQSALAASPACFQGASAGFVRPHLAVGMTGHSISKNNLSIRNQPGTDSQVTGSLSPGDTFKVVEGPKCLDSFVWWKVDNGKLQGWVAEADPATFKYWLEPNNK